MLKATILQTRTSMDCVFKYCRYVYCALILVLQKVACLQPTLKPCDENKLLTYLARIQIINPETIINLPTIDELPALCNEVEENLTDLDGYLKTCNPSQKDLYIQLIQGVDTLFNRLCTKNTFANEFRKHYMCYHQISSDLLNCTGPDDWNENEDDEVLCNFYRLIIECYYMTTVKQCGQEAASILKDLAIRIINSILVVKCDDVLSMFEALPVPEVQKPKSNQAITSSANLAQINLHLCFMAVAYFIQTILAVA